MGNYKQWECCDDLYTEFKFQDLVSAQPPKEKGVYVIRVRMRGEKTKTITDKVQRLVTGIRWELVENRVMSRVRRLERIGQCPVIYIGSAGTHPMSKNTLRDRYKELSSRHTAMYPIWALMYFGWELEYGWKVCADSKSGEMKIKKDYQKIHKDKLPALVER